MLRAAGKLWKSPPLPSQALRILSLQMVGVKLKMFCDGFVKWLNSLHFSPENVKTRNDMFYLQPERSCVPDSPVWYSTGNLIPHAIEKVTVTVDEIIHLVRDLGRVDFYCCIVCQIVLLYNADKKKVEYQNQRIMVSDQMPHPGPLYSSWSDIILI